MNCSGNGTAAVGGGITIPQEIKDSAEFSHGNPLLALHPEESVRLSQTDVHTHVHGSLARDGQMLEAIQLSLMDKQSVTSVSTHHGIGPLKSITLKRTAILTRAATWMDFEGVMPNEICQL